MKILAIDTSCDESCAAILDTESWTLLADVVHSHSERMEAFGGVVPEVASREHLKALPLAVSEALEKAGMTVAQVDHIAVTHRPGLIGALLVGLTYAKALAYALQKPFSIHDHLQAHLFSPCLASLEGGTAPAFPWLALVVSGGHTELYLAESVTEVRWLGGTLDDAAGEAFDKIGKLLGLAYPAGPRIDRWVREEATEADRIRFVFPRSKPDRTSFSFSGLKTSVANQINKLRTQSYADRLALAASAQEAIIDPLVDRLKDCQRTLGIKQLVVTGGVACNSRLRQRLPSAFFPPPKHCSDNAAMVALLAALLHRAGKLEIAPWNATPLAHAELA
jgi:N6-L-threonylcarbamoyladenine synthase